MTNDKLSFLDAKPADKTEVKEVVEKAAPEAKVEAAPAQVEVKPIEPVAAVVPPKDDHNPLLPKYLDTKEKLRDTERRLQELEEKNKEKVETPDPLTDPDGFAAHQQQQFDQKLLRERVNMSGLMAVQVYGKEAVEAAFEALKEKQDQFVYQQIMASEHPYDALVKWHKKEKLLADIGDSPDDWAVKNGYVKQVAPPAEGEPPAVPITPATPVIPAASLSRAPAGQKPHEVPVGPGRAFERTFAR